MLNFRIRHPESDTYCPISAYPGWRSFSNAYGWNDHWLGDHLVYSHRKSHYTFPDFPEQLHNHDYYELLIPIQGDVAFIDDDRYLLPHSGSLILFKPGCIHTARLLSESTYERYVFYLDEEAFSQFGCGSSLLHFLHDDALCITFPAESEDMLYRGLQAIDRTLSVSEPDSAPLAYSYIIQLFYLINHHATSSSQDFQTIPENIRKIKQYVEENYLTLNTTTEISDHFFYRREYVSRLFKEYFNTNLSDYLASLKIRHSKRLLESGASVADACYQSGFHNLSTFNSTFRSQVYMNPSAYRKMIRKSSR